MAAHALRLVLLASILWGSAAEDWDVSADCTNDICSIDGSGPAIACQHSASFLGSTYEAGIRVNFRGGGKFDQLITLQLNGSSGVKTFWEIPVPQSDTPNQLACVPTPIPTVKACLLVADLEDATISGQYGTATATLTVKFETIIGDIELYEGTLGKVSTTCPEPTMIGLQADSTSFLVVVIIFSIISLWSLLELIAFIARRTQLCKPMKRLEACLRFVARLAWSCFATILLCISQCTGRIAAYGEMKSGMARGRSRRRNGAETGPSFRTGGRQGRSQSPQRPPRSKSPPKRKKRGKGKSKDKKLGQGDMGLAGESAESQVILSVSETQT
jgi:hypothetical protein